MKHVSRLLQRLESVPDAEYNQQDIHDYIQTLRSDDTREQFNAIHTLIHIGEPAVMPLIEALCDDQGQAWRLVSVTLIKMGDVAVPHLMTALDHSNESVRLLSAAILQKLGKPAQGEPGWNRVRREYVKLVQLQRTMAQN